jgi:hypothetical protein
MIFVVTRFLRNVKIQDATPIPHDLDTALTGTKHVVLGEIHTIPSVGLNVGADALAILERSSMVLNVSESKYIPPQNLDLREVQP